VADAMAVGAQRVEILAAAPLVGVGVVEMRAATREATASQEAVARTRQVAQEVAVELGVATVAVAVVSVGLGAEATLAAWAKAEVTVAAEVVAMEGKPFWADRQ